MEDKKINQDLTIIDAMSNEMGEYLDTPALFGQMGRSGMPKITVGGYLMREYRLIGLADLLEPDQIALLNTAVSQFNDALEERIVRFEEKAHREAEARIRQWGEYLRDVERDGENSQTAYATAVEARAMLHAIVDRLSKRPFQLAPRISEQIELLDLQLRRVWKPGAFVWPDGWQVAYPEDTFWWLYGMPRQKEETF